MKKRHLASLTAVGVVCAVMGFAAFYAYLNGYFTPPSEATRRWTEQKRLADFLRRWKDRTAEERAAELGNLARALDCRSDALRAEIAQALGTAGPAAVPELVTALQSENADARTAAAHALGLAGETARPAFDPLLAALQDPVPSVRTKAAVALGRLKTRGAEAAPALVRAFGDGDAGVRAAASLALANIGKEAAPDVRAALHDPASEIVRQAVATLALLGPDAADAVPDLTVLLTDPARGLHTESAEALAAVGPAAVPALAAALDDKDPVVRRVVAQALARLGKPATAALLHASQDADPTVRLKALAGLATVGEDGVPPLISAAADADPLFRQETARLLALVTPPDARVAPALVGLLKDPDAAVRGQAIDGLRKLRPEPGPTLVLVKPLLADPARGLHLDALRYAAVTPPPGPVLGGGLRLLGKQLLADPTKPARLDALRYAAGLGADAIPLLAAGLRDPDDDYRKQCVLLLAGVPADSEVLYPVLVPLLKDGDRRVRQDALAVLQRCGPPAIPHLLQALKDDNAVLRQQALWALFETRTKTPEVREAFVGALKDGDADVRGGAALALSQFGPAALPALTTALQDEAPAVRAQAVTALPFLKADAKAVLALVQQAQRDDKPAVRVAAVGALTTFGAKGLPALLDALKDADDGVWRKAVEGLTKVSVPDKILLPLLTDALKDDSPAVRQGAAFALERFGFDAVPSLTQALKDPDRQVCYAATLSLGNIGPVARLAVPAVAEVATNRPEPKLRTAALGALLLLQDLDRFRDDPPRAVSSLVYRCQSQDAVGRYHAILTLGVLGPAAREGIPALEEASHSTDPQTAQAAREALRRVKPAP